MLDYKGKKVLSRALVTCGIETAFFNRLQCFFQGFRFVWRIVENMKDLDLEIEQYLDIDDPKEQKQVICTRCLDDCDSPQSLKRKTVHVYRRAFSETKLLEVLEHDLSPDCTYHVLSGGDIDSLSFLKHIVRQQALDYCLFSTWCMADDDVLQFREWVESGKIGRLDAYVGEIFPGSYKKEWEGLKKVVLLCGGRVAIFRNHAKIYAGIGPKFAFGIESSANINTNPRAENTVITIGLDIFDFYKSYFDGIKSYRRDFDLWKKWEEVKTNG